MVELSTPYWSLDQAIAWALTRDRALVSWAATPANVRGRPVALASHIAFCQVQAKTRGNDINMKLWRKSGWPLSRSDSAGFTVIEVAREGSDVIDDEAYACLPPTRLPPFPIKDYLVELLRAGTLTSRGKQKQPDEMTYRSLSAADWMGLEISERNGIKVAVPDAHARCLSVLLSQVEVLREFPELPVEPNAPQADLRTLLQEGIMRKGAILTQAEAVKIAQEAGAKESRNKIRALWKTLGGSDKPGPKGPRTNRAAPAA